MKKNPSAREIAFLFEGKRDDDNLISDVFDYLKMDCSIRAFIDPASLDESIKAFYESKSMDALTSVIDLILKGKNRLVWKKKRF